MGRIPETALHDGFLRMYNRIRTNADLLFEPALRQMDILSEAAHRNTPELAHLNMEIADASEQSHRLSLLVTAGGISADICLSKQKVLDNSLKGLKAKRKALLRNDAIEAAKGSLQELKRTILSGPESLDSFNEDLFTSLVDGIVVESVSSVRFKLRNGLELQEPLRRLGR